MSLKKGTGRRGLEGPAVLSHCLAAGGGGGGGDGHADSVMAMVALARGEQNAVLITLGVARTLMDGRGEKRGLWGREELFQQS